MQRPRIVILGCGFGGVYVARYLLRWVRKGLCHITLVSRANYFLFTPLLHEVATGGLSLRSVGESLREVFREECIDVRQAEVVRIDLGRKTLFCKEAREILFDYLVIATGAETDYYDVPGAREYAMSLKSIVDAGEIRDRIIDSFERATVISDSEEQKNLLSFVVVGGGATGVEVAGELADFVFGTMATYYGRYRQCSSFPRITLVSKGTELLERFSPGLRAAAKKTLEKKGVSVLLGEGVKRVSPQGVTLENGKEVKAGTVLWLAGVKAAMPEVPDTFPRHSSGRILVDEYLRVKDETAIFALGDCAAFTVTPRGAPLPMFAQVAVREAKVLADNIRRSITGSELVPFRYRSQGDLISIGQWFAIGNPYGIHIRGRIAWWLWRTVYLFKFLSRKKQIRIAVEWTINIFYPRDITKFS